MNSLELKSINLEDRPLFDHYFNAFLPKISEYTFTNLFIWSKPKNIRYAVHEGGLIMTALDRDGRNYFLPPIGFNDCNKVLGFMISFGIQNNIRLIELLPEFQKRFLKGFSCWIEPDRNSFDYIYKTSSLASLKGWRLDGKRGFIKKFLDNYSYEYVQYNEGYNKLCLELYEKWLGGKKLRDKNLSDEYFSFSEFLRNYNSLSDTLAGGLIFVKDRLAAFSFGERLNDTMFVVHFEKADLEFTGSYQIINQLFIQNEVLPKYPFINREQDMGMEGLRKAKLSYVPFKLLKKYTVTF
jgi:hypothetical protein